MNVKPYSVTNMGNRVISMNTSSDEMLPPCDRRVDQPIGGHVQVLVRPVLVIKLCESER